MRRFPVIGVLLACLLFAGAAHAKLPSSIRTTVPPGGSSTLGSPPLDTGTTSMNVDVVPEGAENWGGLQVALAALPTRKARVLGCIGLYREFNIWEVGTLVDFGDVQPGGLSLLLLATCMQLVVELDRQRAAPRAVSAAARCRLAATQVPATITTSRIAVKGTLKRGSPRGAIKVRCRPKGRGITLNVRPSRKGRSLRSAVGPRLRLGVYNPLDATASTRLKLTFRR